MADENSNLLDQGESLEAAKVFSVFAHEWRPLFVSHAIENESIDDVRDHLRDDRGGVIGAFFDNREKLTEVHQLLTEVDNCEVCGTVVEGAACDDHPSAGTVRHFELTALGRKYEEAFTELANQRSLLCDAVRHLLKGMPNETRANIGEIDFVPPLEAVAEDVEVTWDPNPRSYSRYGERMVPMFREAEQFRAILPFIPFGPMTLETLFSDEDVTSSFVFGQSFLEERDEMREMDRVLSVGARTRGTDIIGIRRRFPYVLAIAKNGASEEVFLLGTGNYNNRVAMCFETDNDAIVAFANDLYDTIVEDSERVRLS